MTKTNTDVSKKSYFLRVAAVKNIVTTSIVFLKVEFEGELRISESNLFHSTNADVKKELKKLLKG